MRAFDPVRLGGAECAGWVGYYRRQWGLVLVSAVAGARHLQRDVPGTDPAPLVDALAALYAHVYGIGEDEVRQAAAARAEAMRISDQWVADGCDPAAAAVGQERAELVRSYAALLAAVHR